MSVAWLELQFGIVFLMASAIMIPAKAGIRVWCRNGIVCIQDVFGQRGYNRARIQPSN